MMPMREDVLKDIAAADAMALEFATKGEHDLAATAHNHTLYAMLRLIDSEKAAAA